MNSLIEYQISDIGRCESSVLLDSHCCIHDVWRIFNKRLRNKISLARIFKKQSPIEYQMLYVRCKSMQINI
jgi:hypothetical protein